MSAAGKQRRTVRYSGQVQGVGFRYTTRGIAERYQVAGYVRNLTDGRVELVVEGQRDQIDGFLAEVATSLAGNIREAAVDRTPATSEFSVFEIRF